MVHQYCREHNLSHRTFIRKLKEYRESDDKYNMITKCTTKCRYSTMNVGDDTIQGFQSTLNEATYAESI